MHNDQRFVDGLDAYVWIYDPIPFHYWIFGALLVLGAIGVCLFPLWPPSVRYVLFLRSIHYRSLNPFLLIDEGLFMHYFWQIGCLLPECRSSRFVGVHNCVGCTESHNILFGLDGHSR